MPRFSIVILIFCTLIYQNGLAQNNVPPSLDAVGDQFYCPLSQINVVTDFNIVDPDDTQIESLSIQISTGYVAGQDQLSLSGSHPNIVTTWDASNGKLTLAGVGGAQVLYTDLIAAVKDVIFESSSSTVSGDKYFSFTIGDANYLPSTGHYYEFVSSPGITWTDAKTAAANRTYYGLQGYLATIGSPEEAQLSGEQAGGAGWLGGTDEAVEGVWKWVTGPEAGTIFWNGGIYGSTPPGKYANWNINQPDNAHGGNGEDYLHITDPAIGNRGSWNDLRVAGDPPSEDPLGHYYPKGYIVEYGGMPGDPLVDISASTKITVPSIVSTLDGSSCGPGSVSLEASVSGGTVVWFDTPTGGLQLATGTSFNTPNISTTTTYYALATANGCLEGNRTPVVAIIKDVPMITGTTDAVVCEGGSGYLTASANLGTINWYDSLTGGTLLATGSSFTTPFVTNDTTYYVDATLNGCNSTSRATVIIHVQKTGIPTATPVQTFCDIENATVGNLTASGTDVQWYDVDSGGNPLDASEVLTTKTYNATQTEMGCESTSRFAVSVIIYETVVPWQPSEIPIMETCDTNQDGDDTNGYAEFDLTSNASILLNGKSTSNFLLNYFTDASYTNQIINPNAFVNTVQNGQTVYVRIENDQDNSCYTDTAFTIQVNALPNVLSSMVFKNCDEDGTPDGYTDFNLNEANDILANGNASNYEFTFYLSQVEANSKTNEINPIPFNNSIANTVYVRVENSDGCYRVAPLNLQVSTTSFPSGYLQEMESCDDDDTNDGLHVFDLTQASTQFISQFPTGQNLSVHYYINLTDAQLEQNEITTQTDYINETPFSQILYVRVESEDNGNCFGIGPHLKLTVHPRPEFEVDQADIYCLDNHPITLITYNPSGNFSYEWKDENGVVVSHLPTVTVTEGGTYSVVATSSFGCESFPQLFTVVESAIANINKDDVDIKELSDNNSITINNTNLGIGDYEFALDNIKGPYQDEPFFNHLGSGRHVLFVQDKNGCGVAQLDVFIMGFPKFFTPNDDGYNDTWNLEGLSYDYTPNSRVYIFDRYGKLLKELNPRGEGWNGYFGGEKLRQSDYWFVAELYNLDGTMSTYRGHFSLVR